MDPVIVNKGDSPLVLGFPHVGTDVPAEVHAALNEEGRILRDTDWRVEKLYADLSPGATTVAATFHRYVVDANRDPAGATLYPGQTTTGLVPLTTFDNVPIWCPGAEPDMAEIERRRATFHAPYHRALRAQLMRVKAVNGFALLYDCHSIRSAIPWLFEGTLPDFSIGTDMGRTCAPQIEAAAVRICAGIDRTHVLNGRFRGGWTTRHYGRPEDGIHAIQMELAQSTYLASEEPPFDLDPGRASGLRPQLGKVLDEILEAARALQHIA